MSPIASTNAGVPASARPKTTPECRLATTGYGSLYECVWAKITHLADVGGAVSVHHTEVEEATRETTENC